METKKEATVWRDKIYWKQPPPPKEGEEPGVRSFVFGIPLTDDMLPTSILALDYSGKGFWNAYRLAAAVNFQPKMTAKGVENHYRQSISLAMTGLYYDDLAVIKHVFGQTPILRHETGPSFKALKSTGKSKPTTLWPLVHVSKMATATQSKWGANQEHTIIPAYRMSGKGSQKMDNKAPLMMALSTRTAGMDVFHGGANALSDIQ